MDGITATRRIRETTAADVLPAGFDALMQRLRNVPELKVDLCLSRTNNNPAFYVSLLRRFIPTQRDAAESIQRALNGGDRLQAERLAHTLKGVAASLGADELQERAGLLEENIHQGVSTPEIQAKQLQLADALERLMQHLLAAELVESETPAPTTPMDAQEQCKAQGIVVQVKSLLKQNDANALTVWEQHQALLRRLLPDAGRIEGAIYAFEMELAIELLQEASAPKSA
jgi:two-component system sensor histidine kinase/response regulator